MIYFGEWMNVSVVRGGALLLPYSSFLALMQEKKQKKIKASAEAGEVDRVRDRWSVGPRHVFTLLTVRSSGAYGREGVRGG